LALVDFAAFFLTRSLTLGILLLCQYDPDFPVAQSSSDCYTQNRVGSHIDQESRKYFIVRRDKATKLG
jgi:hypothetical protein